MMNKKIDPNKQLAKNTFFLYIRMFLMLFLSLYTSRVVLSTLGVEDYGLYNVVGGILGMFSMVTESLTSGASRFITYAIGKNDEYTKQSTFSGVCAIQICLAVVVVVLAESIGLWYICQKLVVPEGREMAALGVYQFSIVACVISLFTTPFKAEIIAHEKMSAFAYLSILDAALKLFIVYAITLTEYDKLVFYAFLLLLVQLIDNFLYAAYCKKRFSEVKGSIRINRKLTKELLKYSGWTMTGAVTTTMNNHGLNLLLNAFFGPTVNAARGLANSVQSAILNFCTNFQTALTPQIVKSVAKEDFSRVHELIIVGTRISFFLILLISMPALINIEYILSLWLSIVPAHTSNFVRLVLAISIVHCALANPLIFAINAVGDMKKFQIVEGAILIMILPLSYIALKVSMLEPEIVFIVYFIIEFIAEIARTYIVLPKIHMRYSDYLSMCIFPITLSTIFAIIGGLFLHSHCYSQTFLSFLTTSLCSIVLVCLSTYITCKEREKTLLKQKISSFLNSKFK